MLASEGTLRFNKTTDIARGAGRRINRGIMIAEVYLMP